MRKLGQSINWNNKKECLAVVKQNGLTLKYVQKQTPEICLAAVKEDGLALEYVQKQVPKICLAAVKQNGYALKYVKKQTPEICLAAVKKYGLALKHVREQTPEICLAAVQQNGHALKHVQTKEINMRKLGQITDDLEELLYEMVDDHEMQAYEVIHLIYGWIQAHYPDAIENYKYGGSPVLYYGHKSKLKRKKA